MAIQAARPIAQAMRTEDGPGAREGVSLPPAPTSGKVALLIMRGHQLQVLGATTHASRAQIEEILPRALFRQDARMAAR